MDAEKRIYAIPHDFIAREFKGKFHYILILCHTIWINKTYIDYPYLESDIDVIGLEVIATHLNTTLERIIDTYCSFRLKRRKLGSHPARLKLRAVCSRGRVHYI